MAKEPIRFKSKNRRKPQYTKEGMAQLEALRRENKGTPGMEINNLIMGGRKRGHGRGKASDAGPSKSRRKASP